MNGIVRNMDKAIEIDEISVVRLKIDYELMTLYDAIQADDPIQIVQSKYALKYLRLNLLELENKENGKKQYLL